MRVAGATRHKKRGVRMALPKRSNQLKRLRSPGCTCTLHWVCREKQTADNIKVAVVSRCSEQLEQRPRSAVATDKRLRVSSCPEEHGSRGCSPAGVGAKGLGREEGPEFLWGRKHWLVGLELLPHLLVRRVAERLEGRMEPTSVVSTDLFSTSFEPEVPLVTYLWRFWTVAQCTPATFVVACIYLERGVTTGSLMLTPLTMHRAVLAAVSSAAKFVEDDVSSDTTFARAGGVSGTEFGKLEYGMLLLLKWRLFVSSEELESVAESLILADPSGIEELWDDTEEL
jgi:hypothetical protein